MKLWLLLAWAEGAILLARLNKNEYTWSRRELHHQAAGDYQSTSGDVTAHIAGEV